MPIIDLTKPLHTDYFEDENNVHIKELKQVEGIIKQSLEFIEENSNFKRVHNTILINGKRGYGKTSFALSLIKKLKHNENILVLDEIIDPTIVETKENLFILILHLINNLISTSKINEYQQRDLNQILREIAKGLNVLDGVGKNSFDDWNSPEVILEEGLKNVQGGFKLEKSFHKLIEKILNILDKKMLVLIIDDIDTSINQGEQILELIRKYFTSPKLQIILLGDLDLFYLIIRNLQWKKINPEYTKKFQKDSIKDMYEDEIESLIEQYNIKLFRNENIINLKTLNKLVKNCCNRISVNCNNLVVKKGRIVEHRKIRVNEFINLFIEEFLYENKNYKKFSEFFLSLSLRTIIQILYAFCKYRDDENLLEEKIFYLLLNEIHYKYNPQDLSKVIEDFQENKDYKYYSLYRYYKTLDEKLSLDFLPIYNDITNKLSVVLNINIARYTDKISDLFELYIKFYLPNFRELNYFSNENSYKLARRFILKLRNVENDTFSNISKKIPVNGTIRLTKKQLLELKNNLNDEEKGILNILLTSIVSKNGVYYYLSIWNLLGFIALVLKNYKNLGEEYLKQLLQIKGFYIEDNNDNELLENDLLNEDGYDVKILLKIIKNLQNIDINFSTEQLDSLFTRIDYVIKYIDNDYKNSKNIGIHFHRYIIAILNSFIIVLGSNKNTIYTNALNFNEDRLHDTFCKNYKNLKNEIVKNIISLDIWKFYINNIRQVYNIGNKIIYNRPNDCKFELNIIVDNELIPYNIFNKLSKIKFI